jgi:uncharacterized protein (TIGR03435 family)
MGFGTLTAAGMSVSRLATVLTTVLSRTTVDRTGLSGRFDVELRWTPDPLPDGRSRPPSVDPDAPSIFTAVQEQLGLKLESTTGPVDVLVVDHVERPTPD